MPDYGERRFNTTNQDSYLGEQSKVVGTTHATKMKALTQTKGVNALAMTQLDTYTEASADRKSSYAERGFGSLLPSTRPEDDERHMRTSSLEATCGDGTRKRIGTTQKKLLRQPDAPTAVGRSSQRVEKGLKASGTIGEVFKDVDDPQLNTAVQRSWCYQPDPMLKVQFEGRPADPPFEEGDERSTSIAMKPNMPFDPSTSNARNRFITQHFDHHAIPKAGRSVYLDE